ncbi:hypothetical protein L3Y34_003413 [Caenorhabditis briggsae]|uniref:CBP/p300-type HAT domain-containing protein n=1 Tax=Caenorhabditis briggsae TaxID=6238 RepID=A0AAE9AAH0_CAEBR|nr:hypothetical protein L3Y34_003413 [Caenorhabditis briggsae]
MLMLSMMVRGYVDNGPLNTNQRCSPPQFRSEIYKKLVAAYWDYARSIGFWRCFDYMSTPRKGDDYLLFGHPATRSGVKMQLRQRGQKGRLSTGPKR